MTSSQIEQTNFHSWRITSKAKTPRRDLWVPLGLYMNWDKSVSLSPLTQPNNYFYHFTLSPWSNKFQMIRFFNCGAILEPSWWFVLVFQKTCTLPPPPKVKLLYFYEPPWRIKTWSLPKNTTSEPLNNLWKRRMPNSDESFSSFSHEIVIDRRWTVSSSLNSSTTDDVCYVVRIAHWIMRFIIGYEYNALSRILLTTMKPLNTWLIISEHSFILKAATPS